jgi:hypothetical protein
MFTNQNGQQKEALQDAKGLRKVKKQLQQQQKKQIAAENKTHNQQHMDYLNTNTDISQYTN